MSKLVVTKTVPLIPPLHEFRRGDIAIAGGNGANLGELIWADFPVPGGFVVTTTAYDRFLMHNKLGETIARTLLAATISFLVKALF